MKNYHVLITDQADRDLRAIFEYIALELHSPVNAAKQLGRLEAATEELDSIPDGHRLYEDEPWHSRNLRVFPMDNYVVFYIPDDEEMTVTVIRVIYGGRDMNTQLNHFTKFED